VTSDAMRTNEIFMFTILVLLRAAGPHAMPSDW